MVTSSSLGYSESLSPKSEEEKKKKKTETGGGGGGDGGGGRQTDRQTDIKSEVGKGATIALEYFLLISCISSLGQI